MAVRKIGINCRSMTGRHGFSGQQFESALERDLLDLFAFDLNVDHCEAQPVTIFYEGSDGQIRPYRPDVLVCYRRDVLPGRDMPPLLVEVKYRDEYRGRFHELKQRFRAARRYARERGWQFRVLTEREIRTPYLENARFLRPYRDAQTDHVREDRILSYFATCPESTPHRVVNALGENDLERARLLAVLWKLLAEFRVGVDLMNPMGMDTPIWVQVSP